MYPDNVVVPGNCEGCTEMRAVTDAEVLTMVLAVEDRAVLAAIAGIANEKLRNARLACEQAWLEHRIAEEDRRLAHA